ncbi:MAG: dTDP-glucose 4,6-dehydratase [Xanthomonadales bacterium]|nr:dTDP-glucose 4,6-dehydratase [Gammaproteobacteria bacterium]MBT8054673.1 dTDP-glucose 4,6-dehydratase [Gammaproteobacteria bacterium]NND55763.1 dTDP-glucose 4,6-dehydratase [Xanthomonadales bacterium]NNK50174.1 dTDP-glucose 4,6-dehydratase [Xanthomonadales bacterium]
MRTLLVTGGAGFIGGNYVLRCLSQNSDLRIVNLDALTYAGNLDTLRPLRGDDRHVFIEGDIGDAGLVSKIMAQYRPSAVVNFAAESHVDRSIDGPAAFVQTNVVGTLNLLQCTLDWWKSLPSGGQAEFRFLHVSTDEVYGSLGETGAFLETTPYAPNSPYAASKASSDHLVRAFHHTYGLPTLTTNCSNNYGPYQFPEKLIPLMILNALELKPLPVYGDGLQVRDWLFVNDHVDAINQVLAAGETGEVYNIGGLSERTNMQVVQAICDALDRRHPDESFGSRRQLITHVTDRPGHDRRYAIDCTRLIQATGWRPSVDFETGLQQTVGWYLENTSWIERVRDGSYQGERLGLGDKP